MFFIRDCNEKIVGNADGYKYLSEPCIRYDDILLDMVAEVKERWGLAGDRFGLFGFSGGAQFVNRFLLLRPRSLWAASIGAPCGPPGPCMPPRGPGSAEATPARATKSADASAA